LGFAPALRYRAGSRTEVLILSRLVGATGFELAARVSYSGGYNERLTRRLTRLKGDY
jgi:hypothetical protein